MTEMDDLIKELAPSYLALEKRNVALLEQSLSKKDFALMITLGDKIYGHGASYGFERIGFLGRRIQNAAIGQDLHQLSLLIAALKSSVNEAIDLFGLESD